VPGFFLGGATAELAVVYTDENDIRRLQMYGLDGGAWSTVLEAELSPTVLFVDVANIGGHDRLITYEDGRINWFNPASAADRVLLEIATNYTTTYPSEIPHLDITRDVNHDGRDDLVVPDVDGFWISTQRSDGSFSGPLKPGPPEPFLDEIAFGDTRSYGQMGITAQTNPSYQSRVHEVDCNQDGRSDLLFWNEDHFEVHYQDALGSFDPVAETFTTEVPFDSEGVYSFGYGFSDASNFSLFTGLGPKNKRTVLHSFSDMNGDGVVDLVTQSLQGRSLLRLRSRYEAYFGLPTADGISFDPSVGMDLHPQGRAKGGSPLGYSLGDWQDLDGDGQIEFMFGRVDTGVGGFFRAIVVNSIAIDLEYYRIENGIYPEQPNGSLRIKPDFDFVIGGRGPFFPTVLVGEVNGDHHADLLVGENWDELHVYLGVPGPDVFARRPQTVAVALSANEQNTRLVDLNQDDKQDVLIHHPSTTEPHRLMVLIAR
jgi:hypothetical protein|tara:strand:- start:17746 stop:19197 length:1452 start_codon:yes stop_codon:yes gene_type:complete